MNKKLISIIFGLFPLLSVYSLPNLSFDFGTILIILMFLISFNSKIMLDRKMVGWGFCVIIFFISIIINLINNNYHGLIVYFRALNILIIPSLVFLLIVNNKINFEISIKTMKVLTYFNTVIIIFQIFLSRIGIYVQNGFVYFSKSSDYKDRIVSGPLRPSGVFLEPAHFIQYAVVLLIIVLLSNSKNNKKQSFIIVIGMFLTTSAQGYLNIFLVFSFYCVHKIFLNRYSLKKILGLFSMTFVTILFIVTLIMRGYFDFIFERLFTENISLGGNAISARTSGYLILSDLKEWQFLFGNGLGNTISGIYSSGYVVLIWTTGIIGLLSLILVCVINTKRNLVSVSIVLMFFFMMFFSQIFTASSLAFYLGLAWWGSFKKNDEENIDGWHHSDKLQYLE